VSAQPASRYLDDLALLRPRIDALLPRFDRLILQGDALFPQAQGWALQALLLAYEAYADPAYLEKFVAIGDQVLGYRDSERGVRDYRGQSLPAWRAPARSSLETCWLRDVAGQPVFLVRAHRGLQPPRGGAWHGWVQVDVVVHEPGARFSLEVTRRTANGTTSERFDDLTMNPAPGAIGRGLPGNAAAMTVNTTSRLITLQPANTSVTPGSARLPERVIARFPAAGTSALADSPFVSCIYTGHLAWPFARFVRLVQDDAPDVKARHNATAERYLDAARAEIAANEV